MSDADKPAIGSVAWRDLTVGDAEGIRDFYQSVVGWDSAEVAMDDYFDFSMVTPLTGETVAGVCHARGVNQELPPLWLIYIVVDDLAESLRVCKELGGSVIVESRPLAEGLFCVIRDPAGAVCALFQAPGEVPVAKTS